MITVAAVTIVTAAMAPTAASAAPDRPPADTRTVGRVPSRRAEDLRRRERHHPNL